MGSGRGCGERFCLLDYGEKFFDAMAHSDDANARRRTFSGNNRETGRRRGTVRERKGRDSRTELGNGSNDFKRIERGAI